MMVEKRFEHNGLPCLVKRIDGMGHLCGYVGIPEKHPLFGKDLFQLMDHNFYPCVHGGVTYSKALNPETWEEDSDTWWIGFDCNHYGDWSPCMADMGIFDGAAHFWTVGEVEAETRYLAEQLAKVE